MITGGGRRVSEDLHAQPMTLPLLAAPIPSSSSTAAPAPSSHCEIATAAERKESPRGHSQANDDNKDDGTEPDGGEHSAFVSPASGSSGAAAGAGTSYGSSTAAGTGTGTGAAAAAGAGADYGSTGPAAAGTGYFAEQSERQTPLHPSPLLSYVAIKGEGCFLAPKPEPGALGLSSDPAAVAKSEGHGGQPPITDSLTPSDARPKG